MALNTYKAPTEKAKSAKKSKFGGFSVFKLIETSFKMEGVFGEGVPVHYFPKVLFGSFLAIVYIANSHYADKTVRRISKLKVEVEDLRADYTTLKADYMFAGKQSEVAKNVQSIGLVESAEPPYKVVVKKGEFDPQDGD